MRAKPYWISYPSRGMVVPTLANFLTCSYYWTDRYILWCLFGQLSYPLSLGFGCIPLSPFRSYLPYLHRTPYTRSVVVRTYTSSLHAARTVWAHSSLLGNPRNRLRLVSGVCLRICMWSIHACASIISTSFQVHSSRSSYLYPLYTLRILPCVGTSAQILYDTCNSNMYVLNYSYPFWIALLWFTEFGVGTYYILPKEGFFVTRQS